MCIRDSGYISGEKEIFGIISQNLADTDFFSFGIGDSVNRYLIDGIAKVGLGESFVVTDDKDALDTVSYTHLLCQGTVKPYRVLP